MGAVEHGSEPSMAEPLRVVIADDNYLVREGTRRSSLRIPAR